MVLSPEHRSTCPSLKLRSIDTEHWQATGPKIVWRATTVTQDIGWRGAGSLSLKCILQGECSYDIGHRITLRSGDALVVNHAQEFLAERTTGFEESVFLFFNRSWLPNPNLEFINRRLSTAVLGNLPRRLAQNMNWFEAEEALLSILLTLVDEENKLQGIKLHAKKATIRNELLQTAFVARDFIHDNQNAVMGLSEIARAACVSPTQLFRVFRAAFGTTPYQYLLRLRHGSKPADDSGIFW